MNYLALLIIGLFLLGFIADKTKEKITNLDELKFVDLFYFIVLLIGFFIALKRIT